MKFIPVELVKKNMLPLNVTYYQPNSYDEADILTITFKDADTNMKTVFSISNPEIEMYITKPENRDYSHMRDYYKKDMCNMYKVRYRNRWRDAAKLLKLQDGKEAKRSPYVFGIDVPIENYYLIQFLLEYPTEAAPNLSLGFLDIENDIIQSTSFPEPGETPVNAVTYINAEFGDVYTLILCKDNLPVYHEGMPDYARMKPIIDAKKEKFYNQVNYIKEHQAEFKAQCQEKFSEVYGDLNYILLLYDEETTLLEDLFKIIHSTDNDFIGIWNMPYDISNLLQRPINLNMDRDELVCDPRFPVKHVTFTEDTNPVVHKRRHKLISSTIPSFVDDMVHYAGIRSVGNKLPSYKLGSIAKNELKDDKYDYSEVSDIKNLFYDDFNRFILYNIKDTLLLLGLSRKNGDMNTIYSRMTQMALFPSEAFTTTKVVLNSLILFGDKKGYTFGINRNKGNHTKKVIDFGDLLSKNKDFINDDEEIDIELEPEYDEDGNVIENETDDKFPGAFVMNPLHMNPTGVIVNGKPSKYIHDNVGDADVTSEYPTDIITSNKSNETLVGKVYLEDADKIDIPINGFTFKGDDRDKYKMNVSDFMMEVYTENDILNFGNIFLDLPGIEEILDDAGNLIDEE